MTTMPPCGEWSSLVEMLRWRAIHEPCRVAYTYLRDGIEPSERLDYAELDRRARTAAARLRRIADPGDRVLLVYPSGLEILTAFFGSLYAGLVAVPAYPPRPQQIDPRIRAIAVDARPRIAATTIDLAPRLQARFAEDPELSAIRCVALDGEVDDPGGNPGNEWQPPPVTRSTLAHLQYTSGSTATPKGVMVTHGNVLQNLAELDLGWAHDQSSTIVSWLPAFHDMGLVYGLLEPIYTGVHCVVMPPVSFIQRPIRWLQAMSRFRGTHSAAPNFAYDLCVRKVKPADRSALDLSAWRVAVNGAEPVRADTLDRFSEAFAPCGFRREAFAPGYGLAEATLRVTAARCGAGPTTTSFSAKALEERRAVAVTSTDRDARTLVACGAPVLDTRIAIADPETREPCPDGRIGEIWVGGSSVAAGYWNREAETAATFHATWRHDETQRFLRTGDLGFLSDGQLYVAGRIKDIIIVHGQNHYPQDIEVTAERCDSAFRPAGTAAFAIDRDGEERVVIVQEVDRHFGPEQQRRGLEAIRVAVARAHDLHVFDVAFVRAGSIPKTSSGKIQRRACRDAYLRGELVTAAEGHPV